eukprot:TRINITY_DN10704_c0_g1_i1.p1 TRINITY_DN10704_c0_g1~~TRINITY_DN10704_c0_g1_i1.p1  ORF type:complete len:431 (-),score=103.68 TRINITY_DN10704_c0_g1_i1:104-1396(-)
MASSSVPTMTTSTPAPVAWTDTVSQSADKFVNYFSGIRWMDLVMRWSVNVSDHFSKISWTKAILTIGGITFLAVGLFVYIYERFIKERLERWLDKPLVVLTPEERQNLAQSLNEKIKETQSEHDALAEDKRRQLEARRMERLEERQEYFEMKTEQKYGGKGQSLGRMGEVEQEEDVEGDVYYTRRSQQNDYDSQSLDNRERGRDVRRRRHDRRLDNMRATTQYHETWDSVVDQDAGRRASAGHDGGAGSSSSPPPSAYSSPIVRQQQEEFNRSLQEDRQREERERLREAEIESRKQHLRDEETKVSRRRERRKQAHARLTASSEQTKDGVPDVTIVVRFPDGQRIQRSFASTQTIRDVFQYVDSCMTSPTQVTIESFNLVTNFPVKAFRCRLEAWDAGGGDGGSDDGDGALILRETCLVPRSTLFLDPIQ